MWPSLHPNAGRPGYANFALGGGSLLILLLSANLHSHNGWRFGLAAVALASSWAWFVNLKRYRTVADTPTSRIASAPQGYVELNGRGKQPPGDGLISPLSGLPCLWYRYRIERRDDDRWEHVESASSHDTFGMDDGSGMVLIDPDGAEIFTSRKQVSTSGGYRHTEWTLIEGETLYAIGEHVTLGGPNATLDRKGDLAALLAEWKRDKATLLARFDTDRDGAISLDEWEHARRAASVEIDHAHLDTRLKDGVHLIRKPAHGRPYLIANRDVNALARHFRLWSWLHLALLLAALYGLTGLGRMS
jgi:hypothetical protein